MNRSRGGIGVVPGVGAAVIVLATAFLAPFGCSRDPGDVTAPLNQRPTASLQVVDRDLREAIAVQERHTDRLMALPGVVGTAVGLTSDGRPAIHVYTRSGGVQDIPREVEEVPVEVRVTGELFALGAMPARAGIAATPAAVDPTVRFSRPVPIGISTGNAGECSAGTIGARVKRGARVFALSNNHVYALENSAPIGSDVLQPGRFDTGCASLPANEIGELTDFVAIVFSTFAFNRVDAAIARSSKADLGRRTPSDGYGIPRATVVGASLDEPVQKYGRTTSLTRGRITGINATLNIGYSSGTARFVDQIIVGSPGAFIQAGDSGSLLVTDPGRNPTGLLFAGSGDGRTAIANRIDLVLDGFEVSIDGR